MSRTLLAFAAVCSLLLLSAVSAVAVETTTGYQQTPPTPNTTTTGYQQTPTKPASGTGPSKETATPTSSASPAKSTSPSTTTHEGSSTLPFTGLDLRWIVLGGVLLLGMGLSLRMTQRRQSHNGR